MADGTLLIVEDSAGRCTGTIRDDDGNVLAVVPPADSAEQVERNADLLGVPYDMVEHVFE